ncbi:hypothetical protein ABID65_008165 [Bradyrhizobium sp. S3.9.2]|uniref:hypothetical protein n=1 Tax=Bradyrhizobium sp. S3.9.2 TaxID=3156432 RepID=UPI0033919DDC
MNERDQARFVEMITRFVDARCRTHQSGRERHQVEHASPFSQDGVVKSARITVVVARTVSQ